MNCLSQCLEFDTFRLTQTKFPIISRFDSITTEIPYLAVAKIHAHTHTRQCVNQRGKWIFFGRANNKIQNENYCFFSNAHKRKSNFDTQKWRAFARMLLWFLLTFQTAIKKLKVENNKKKTRKNEQKFDFTLHEVNDIDMCTLNKGLAWIHFTSKMKFKSFYICK